jgi:hypothetical protein
MMPIGLAPENALVKDEDSVFLVELVLEFLDLGAMNRRVVQRQGPHG